MKNRLRELRTQHSLSQGEVADIADVSRQTINAIEANKYDPSLPLAYKLAAHFGVPVEQLFFNPFLESEGSSQVTTRRVPGGGMALALGLAFSTVLDPPAKAATEEIEKKRESGSAESASGEKHDPLNAGI